MGGNEPWYVTLIVDKPRGADVQCSSVGSLQESLNDVASPENRLFLPGDLVVHRVLPQGSIEFLPLLRIKTEVDEKRGLAFASPVSSGK